MSLFIVRVMFRQLKLHEQFDMVNNHFVRLQHFARAFNSRFLPRFSKAAWVLHCIASIGTL